MYEKILQKLKIQRGTTSNVSDRSLEDLAKSLESIITTDEILQKAELSSAIKSIDGNISHYTSDVLRKVKEKEEADKAKAAQEENTRKTREEETKKKQKEGIPDYILDIMAQNKASQEALSQLNADLLTLRMEKTDTTRQDKLNKMLTGLPAYLSNPIITSFKSAKFDTEESFSSYLSAIESDTKAFVQAAKEQGLNTISPKSEVKLPELNGETPELRDARVLINKMKKDETNNNIQR